MSGKYGLFLLLLPLTGCMYVEKDWHTKPTDDAPWTAPDTKAVSQERMWQMFLAPAWYREYRWADIRGHPVADPVDERAAEYLLGTAMAGEWPVAPAEKQLPARKVPPFDFVLVSIRPNVYLMWPEQPNYSYDWNRLEGISIGNLARAPAITNLPPVDSLLWFSPDLRAGPRPPEMIDSTHAQITWPGGRILLTRTTLQWTTRRE